MAARKQSTSRLPAELPEVNFSDWGDIRYLHLGTEWVQGSMKLDAPYEIELEYTYPSQYICTTHMRLCTVHRPR